MESEQEYLSRYRIEDYPRPSVTTDIAAFRIVAMDEESYRKNPESKLCILLVKRGQHPYKDCWALPGGFLMPGESVEDCALREITEETGITPTALLPVGVFSTPGRDPRGWILSHGFASVICQDDAVETAGSDAGEAAWFQVELQREGEDCTLTLTGADTQLKVLLREQPSKFRKVSYTLQDGGGLAFDHGVIIATALQALRRGAAKFDFLFAFLPEKFTLSALQRAQETIMNISVLPANFRRKIAEYIEETEESTAGAGHRPAKLYRKKKGI